MYCDSVCGIEIIVLRTAASLSVYHCRSLLKAAILLWAVPKTEAT